MGITRLRASTQVKAGSVDSTNVADRALIPQDFAVWPLVPQNMTTAERDDIVNPPTGLTIFNTDTGLVNVYDGTAWTSGIDPSSLIGRLVVSEDGQLVLDNNGDIVFTL
jgi:hypothetical protein